MCRATLACASRKSRPSAARPILVWTLPWTQTWETRRDGTALLKTRVLSPVGVLLVRITAGSVPQGPVQKTAAFLYLPKYETSHVLVFVRHSEPNSSVNSSTSRPKPEMHTIAFLCVSLIAVLCFSFLYDSIVDFLSRNSALRRHK